MRLKPGNQSLTFSNRFHHSYFVSSSLTLVSRELFLPRLRHAPLTPPPPTDAPLGPMFLRWDGSSEELVGRVREHRALLLRYALPAAAYVLPTPSARSPPSPDDGVRTTRVQVINIIGQSHKQATSNQRGRMVSRFLSQSVIVLLQIIHRRTQEA